MSVPEPDVAISCATAGREESVLVGTPSNRFHGGRVVVELGERLI